MTPVRTWMLALAACGAVIGASPASAQQLAGGAIPRPNSVGLIGQLIGANFNSTADQPIPILSQVTKYRISEIDVTGCSTSLTLAAGGFYSAASKGGTAIVSAAQLYSGLTGSTLVLNPTISATGGTTAWTASTIYFSLTTAQGGAATCNIAIIGVDLTGM